MKLKLKEQLLGFLFLAPIFVAIPIACLERVENPPPAVTQSTVTAPMSMKAVVDAEREDREKKKEVSVAPESFRR